MINAKELRIGNWLVHDSLDQGERYIRIVEIRENDFRAENDEVFPTRREHFEMEGIPLTPELLEECGFERIMEFASDTNWTYKMVTKTKIKLFYHCGNSSFMIGEPLASRTTVIYVHQLQNLYFALTGEELNISL